MVKRDLQNLVVEAHQKSGLPGKAVKEPFTGKKAFTIERKDGAWIAVTLLYEGQAIVERRESEPTMKACAMDRCKIETINYWSSLG